MARETVLVTRQIAAPPSAVWAVARDFCGAWHPAIATIHAERGAMGAEIRAFAVQGDATLYREQRIYRSDSDRSLSYLALEGVAGADRYVARLTVTPSDGGCTVTWGAEITAPAPRAAQIAKGTAPIFEAGMDGLIAALGAGFVTASVLEPMPMQVPPAGASPVPVPAPEPAPVPALMSEPVAAHVPTPAPLAVLMSEPVTAPVLTPAPVPAPMPVPAPLAAPLPVLLAKPALVTLPVLMPAPAPAPMHVPAPATAPPATAKVPLETVILPGTPRLALTVTPQRSGPLVLFLHGIGGARGNWTAQLHAISALGRGAAMDLRGYGDSTLGFAQTCVDDHCDDILRATRALGAEKFILCGLSLGAWIATSFAMRHADRLLGLVLSGGCTGMSEAGPEEREAFRLSREVPLNAGQTPADFAPAVVKVLAGPQASAAMRADLLASMSAIPAATYRDALVCFTNPPERFDFARLSLPVLMMTGQHDRLAPPSEIRAVAGRILDTAQSPDVEFEEIAGAGHLCNIEQPQTYNAHLTRFVQRVAP